MTELPRHTEHIASLLKQIDEDRERMLELGQRLIASAEGRTYWLDFLAYGAIKRNIGTARAFHAIIESWNMVCARALLRMHIDTGLRFSAAWLVDEPHEFARRVLIGERIDKMKDSAGERLTDAHLVHTRAQEYQWLPTVYARLSSYVHLSGSHIIDSITCIDDEQRKICFEWSELDLKYPEFSWLEVCRCFREATAMLGRFVTGYAHTKNMTPEELSAARRERDSE